MRDDIPMWSKQAQAVEFATYKKKTLHDIDPGLGKTRIACETYGRLCPGKAILVVTTKGSFPAYMTQAPRWLDHVNESDVILISGKNTTKAKRQRQWQKARKYGKVICTTYHSLMNEPGMIPWSEIGMVAWDECHKIRRHTAPAIKPIEELFHRLPYGIAMTGTLVNKGPQDLFTYLHLLDPKLFSSYWRFVNTFCTVVKMPFGREIVGPKNVQALRQVLKGYLFRIKEDDPEVKAQRPPLIRDVIRVNMTPRQMIMYETLEEELLLKTSEGYIASPNQAANRHKLRRLLISPGLIDPEEELGPTLETLLEMLDDDPHSCVFTPYRECVNYIAGLLEFHGYNTVKFIGGNTSGEEILEKQNFFNQKKRPEDKVVSVGTTQFAQSFELYTAKRCFHVGFCDAADDNYQAEKRLHRLITPHPITSYYFVTRGTIEEMILDRLNTNMANVKVTFQDYQNFARIRRQNLLPVQK